MQSRMSILSYICVEVILVFGASLAETNYFIFKNYLMTRDEAHFCCRKYGMTLMSIRSQDTNAFLTENFKISQHTAIWLGIFNDPGNIQNMIWSNSTPIEYNNFDPPTNNTIDNMSANLTSATELCLYGEVGNDLTWKIAQCSQKLDFGCEIISPGVNVLPPVIPEAICPDLVKMTAFDVMRRGAITDNSGKTSAGTYGYFKREELVYTMGTQIGYDKTEDNIECILRCLETSGCNDIIILDKIHCIMYQM